MGPGSLYSSNRKFTAAARPADAPPREIAFLADAGVETELLVKAARRARDQGVFAEEVLIAEGFVEEEFYYRALARRLNCPYLERAVALRSGFDYRAAMRAGVARADRRHEDFDFLLAPRGAQIAELLSMADHGGTRERIALCAPKFFSALARAKSRRALSDDASFALPRANAKLSAGAPQVRRSAYVAVLLCALILAGLVASSSILLILSSLVLSALFLGGVYARLCAVVASGAETRAAPPLSDCALPTYTIIAALYREASVAKQFVAAMKALDYPAAKLDIKIVLEDDDGETAAALRRAKLAPNMEIVIAPYGMPRTKPRALNVALPLARGELIAVYDAEDRPAPDQLRVAAAAFATAAPNIACLQARLVTDNGHESWLSYFFSISYAALFDVINPGFAALGLPVPLGGTSNHFRARLLRRAFGWDAWNVTEDADLGLRLARFGYRVETIDSATFEDAPTEFSGWLGQRARWMKGWMQTLAVFLRAPRAHMRKMGAFPAFAALCHMASLTAGPLFGPIYALRLIDDLLYGDLLAPQSFLRLVFASLSLAVAIFGAVAFVLPNLVGMRRRRLSPSWRLLLAPFYLLALSLAAWRALAQWTLKPFVWTKTAHVPHPVPAAASPQAVSVFANFPASASAMNGRALPAP